jgi:preprotein translocase subunit YajC
MDPVDFLPIVVVFLIFYFIVFKPGSKERKARELALKNIKKHDRVITNAGIHGIVVALDEDTVTLRVDDKNNVRIRFARAAVWQVNPEGVAGGEAPAPAPIDEPVGGAK